MGVQAFTPTAKETNRFGALDAILYASGTYCRPSSPPEACWRCAPALIKAERGIDVNLSKCHTLAYCGLKLIHCYTYKRSALPHTLTSFYISFSSTCMCYIFLYVFLSALILLGVGLGH